MTRTHLAYCFTAIAMLIAFVLLRLAHVTSWSWWAVTAVVWLTWLAYLAVGVWLLAIAIASRLGWIR